MNCALVPGLERNDLHAVRTLLDYDTPLARRAQPLLCAGWKGLLQLHFVALGIGHIGSLFGRVRVPVGFVVAVQRQGVYACAVGLTALSCG
jgi:hypothetical protein